jgi:hypothetical protein
MDAFQFICTTSFSEPAVYLCGLSPKYFFVGFAASSTDD